MKKTAKEITVEVIDGIIRISQENPPQEHPDMVDVSPDQVVQLIEWLRDCRDQIRTSEPK